MNPKWQHCCIVSSDRADGRNSEQAEVERAWPVALPRSLSIFPHPLTAATVASGPADGVDRPNAGTLLSPENW